MTIEKTFYSEITDGCMAGSEGIEPEDFIPMPGTILVVLIPPKTVTPGGIILPETAQQDQTVARVAAVPDDAKCLVKPGDWVILRRESGVTVAFGQRNDLRLINYTEGPDSEICGKVDGPVKLD